MTDSSAARPAHGSTARRKFSSHARVAARVCETARLFYPGGQPEHGRSRRRDSDLRGEEADRSGGCGAALAAEDEWPGAAESGARARSTTCAEAESRGGPGRA